MATLDQCNYCKYYSTPLEEIEIIKKGIGCDYREKILMCDNCRRRKNFVFVDPKDGIEKYNRTYSKHYSTLCPNDITNRNGFIDNCDIQIKEVNNENK